MKPIIFNTEMVRAILEDRKTVTRKIIKPQMPADGIWGYTMFTPKNHISFRDAKEPKEWFIKMPYVKGDILYVRETWCDWPDECGHNYFYKATDDGADGFSPKWRPSIHMPKSAARLFLKVTNVRVEKLHDITFAQIVKEGLPDFNSEEDLVIQIETCLKSCSQFEKLWNASIKKTDLDRYGWDGNPWVWVIEFERISKQEALLEEK